MQTLLKVLAYILIIIFALFALGTIFFDYLDVLALYGYGCFAASVALFPFTVVFFPLVLGIYHGSWGQAIATYIIIPILLLSMRFVSSRIEPD